MFEQSYSLFKIQGGRIVNTSVNVAVTLARKQAGTMFGTVESECGSLVDRHDHAAVGIFESYTMYKCRVKSGVFLFHIIWFVR